MLRKIKDTLLKVQNSYFKSRYFVEVQRKYFKSYFALDIETQLRIRALNSTCEFI